MSQKKYISLVLRDFIEKIQDHKQKTPSNESITFACGQLKSYNEYDNEQQIPQKIRNIQGILLRLKSVAKRIDTQLYSQTIKEVNEIGDNGKVTDHTLHVVNDPQVDNQPIMKIENLYEANIAKEKPVQKQKMSEPQQTLQKQQCCYEEDLQKICASLQQTLPQTITTEPKQSNIINFKRNQQYQDQLNKLYGKIALLKIDDENHNKQDIVEITKPDSTLVNKNVNLVDVKKQFMMQTQILDTETDTKEDIIYQEKDIHEDITTRDDQLTEFLDVVKKLLKTTNSSLEGIITSSGKKYKFVFQEI